MKKIIIKPSSPNERIFTYRSESYSIDEHNFIVFEDDRGVQRKIPLYRILEVIEND
jgi:hypothetical protein